MITSKKELKNYLNQDRIALYKSDRNHPRILGDEIWKWEILLRKFEYYSNIKRNIFHNIALQYIKFRFHKMSIKLGFSIPINVFGPGLSIAHYGYIVVNSNAKVGCNCRIQEGVTIGTTNGERKAPIIGNNVFIGSGAKIIGNIKVEDNVSIGAGAVVVRDVVSSITVGGIPAKKISDNDSRSNLNCDLFN